MGLALDEDELEQPEPKAKAKPERRRKRPSRSAGSRFQRRADKATETVRELIRLGRPDLDVSGLSFLEVVDRDAKAWGEMLAQLGEWFVPLGSLIDLVFGAALVRLLKMAPSFRAAKRDRAARREQRRRDAEDEQAAEQARAERDEDALRPWQEVQQA